MTDEIEELYERLNRTAVTSHNRGHIISEQRQKITELQKQLDFLEDVIEAALTTGRDCHFQLKHDYEAYQQEFCGIKEDRPHKDPGKARAAKTARTKSLASLDTNLKVE
jgi:hypothetical protein